MFKGSKKIMYVKRHTAWEMVGTQYTGTTFTKVIEYNIILIYREA